MRKKLHWCQTCVRTCCSRPYHWRLRIFFRSLSLVLLFGGVVRIASSFKINVIRVKSSGCSLSLVVLAGEVVRVEMSFRIKVSALLCSLSLLATPEGYNSRGDAIVCAFWLRLRVLMPSAFLVTLLILPSSAPGDIGCCVLASLDVILWLPIIISHRDCSLVTNRSDVISHSISLPGTINRGLSACTSSALCRFFLLNLSVLSLTAGDVD